MAINDRWIGILVMTTAGHTWGLDGRCTCGKRLSDISFAAYDPSWVGQPDIAHTLNLNHAEQKEIARDVEAIWAAAVDGAKV